MSRRHFGHTMIDTIEMRGGGDAVSASSLALRGMDLTGWDSTFWRLPYWYKQA